MGNSHPSITPYEAFPAQDRWFALASANERQWSLLCEAIGAPELALDPRFGDNSSRVAHRSELRAILIGIFQQHTADHWLATFRDVGLPCGPINEIPEVFAHPQAESEQLVVEGVHPTAGPVRFAGFPYKFSETPAQVRMPPPRLGEHTEQVLHEILDYSAADIAGLRADGAI